MTAEQITLSTPTLENNETPLEFNMTELSAMTREELLKIINPNTLRELMFFDLKKYFTPVLKNVVPLSSIIGITAEP
ncbi:MAG: hypothetical protein US60_C0001G0057 [Microgenomates group bacterium GW2011_GWC1_37_8]|nr:MAG: hypothetical protein US60_C0001G0057 [Microgenomates group bacterium GW2011_GWC1_37_8]